MREGAMTATVLQQTVDHRPLVHTRDHQLSGKTAVPKQLFTPLSIATKDNISTIDLSGVRAPAGWKPPVR